MDVHRWLSLGSALANTRRCSGEFPAVCLLLPAQQTHKASTASQLTRPLSFTHPQNLLCKRNKVTGSRNNNPQERSCGKEVNQLCFVPPCPQLCDRNLSSATGVSFAELRPVFPLPDLGFLNPDQPLPPSAQAAAGASSALSSPGQAAQRLWLAQSKPERLNPCDRNQVATTTTHRMIFISCF